MELSETIRQLRNDHHMTQEELASLCHVSHVAISKWETGKSLPDITLLPILARIFEVSIDELLNFKKTLSDEEVMALSKESIDRFSKEPFAQALSYTKSILRMYPNSELLKLRIAGNIMHVALCVQDEELIKEYRQFSLPLVKSVIQSQNAVYQHNARIQCVNLLNMEEKVEEALDILKPIPKLNDPSIIEASLYRTLKRDEEAIVLLESFIYFYIQNISLALSTLLNIKFEQNHEEQEMEQIIQLLQTIQESFQLEAGSLDQVFVLYAKQQNKERTLHYLSQYVDRLLGFDGMQQRIQDGFAKVPWFSELPRQQHPQTYPPHKMIEAGYLGLLDMECLQFLKEDAQFQELLAKLNR